ncbi:MAG: glycosyltransferase [Patescibacteria group bacterium]
MSGTNGLRIAIVHDYLIQDGGGERVVRALQEMFPAAPTYTLFYNPNRTHASFRGKDIRVSDLQRLPFIRGREEWTLPFMPMAIEHFDLSGYDIVISSSSTFAKGAIAAPNALHICYLHTPTRFLWEDRQSYVNDLSQPRLIKRLLPPILHRLRLWDRIAAERPDIVVTNSQTSRARIRRYYGRDAMVIHPPVDVLDFHASPAPRSPESSMGEGGWVTGGRLVGYKRFDLTVRAFAKLNMPLKVFGVGPELKRLKRIAGSKTEFLGWISEDAKRELFSNAIGFIHPHVEDFGITAVEAMAAGKPIIAYGQGGAAETVVPGVTGEYIEAQTWEDIGDAIIRFDPSKYDPIRIHAHAESFSDQLFKQRFGGFLNEVIQKYQR